MRAAGITFISLALTTAVVGNAYYHKKQFYPSVVYITKSNPSMAVIYIQVFILVVLLGKLMRKVFFGQLRAAEFEHLVERSWYAVTETCLAFTVFRDDFSPKFVALFTVLLFLKSFHWLAEDRVDFMERSPVISWLFHVRVLCLLTLLGTLDFAFINHAYQSTVLKGASVQLVFGFEYAILLTIILNITIKYMLHTVDLNSENPWENKAVFLLYTELIMGFTKVLLYVTFVAIMVRLYTLPLFAFRPMYYTMRKFKQAYSDVILSRRAIQNMNTLYPDATAEELAAADNVCIICREEMTTASKKLPCNHIFHTACLRSWFQRQQTCPTCRLNILRTPTPPAAHQQQQQQAPRQQQPQVAQPPPPIPPFPLFRAFHPAVPHFWNQPPPPPAPQQAPPAAGAGAAGQPGSAGPAAPQTTPSTSGQQRGQEGTSEQQSTPGTSDASSPPNSDTGEQRQVPGQQFAGLPPPPPFFYPMPPLFGMFPAPPMPPPDFTGLSDDELRRLEGNHRENIQARLQCLRQIELLLDASVTMMQQYMSAVVTADISRNNVAGQQRSTYNVGVDGVVNGESEEQSSTASGPVPDQAATASTSSAGVGVDEESSKQGPPLTKEQEEVRRRRLQKFAQNVSGAAESS